MSNVNWRDSDPSEDEINHDAQPGARKRSSRACDQCRKTKSKCERSFGDAAPCKSCALAGTACTFLGPSYKRGPPKGYIHAIEQRWHQVECLLGAILQCPDPRVQSIISDLRKDDLAREIIGRVDTGPYGPSGRRNQPVGATKEDFFASILRSSEGSPARDPARSRRQSRVSREIVSSNQDHGLSVVPTTEWQDNLSASLAASSSSPNPPSTNYDFSPNATTFDNYGAPLTQRRRLDISSTDTPIQPDWNDMYTMDLISDTDEYNPHDDPAEGIGQLSLDENKEVRFHGKASGLHLLGRSDRTDDRNEGGIWKMPMARVWPPSKNSMIHFCQEEDVDVQLPPLEVQDRLVELYLTYIHPVFPVLHKTRFMVEYNANKHSLLESSKNSPGSASASSPSPSPLKPEPVQKVSKLLLLAIFAISARFTEDEAPLPPKGKMWEAGCNYLDSARTILTKVFHRSRPSTVQALLLLGYREFGIGSMEQGWIYIGMAIRMAVDLGLNCDSGKWKTHGVDLFAAEETQTRRQIWWTCCLADRYGSVYMGRPISINETDFDTPLPDVNQDVDNEPWQPLASDPININYPPVPARLMSSFCAAARLSVITGVIITRVYPVRPTPGISRRSMFANLEHRLDQWYIGLPENLRYDTTSKRVIPPPHILFLHIRYWGAVLLLNRGFIPNWRGIEPTPRNSTIELKAFDLSQGAASHVSAIVTAYRENFTLKRTSPFLTCYILSAGIMHILTLTLRPSNLQASLGLRQCMSALKEMEVIWPSASRAWDLLNGVKLGFDNGAAPLAHAPDRHKRHAEDAFGQEKSSDYLQREAFGVFEGTEPAPSANGVQDLSTRMMAHMLGLDIPGIEPSTSFYPGYEWWPRPQHNTQSISQPMSPAASGSSGMNTSSTPSNGGVPFTGPPAVDEWLQDTSESASRYSYNFSPMIDHFGL